MPQRITNSEIDYNRLGNILDSIHPGVTIADSQGIFRYVSDSYLKGRSIGKESIIGKFAGSPEMLGIFSPCVTNMVYETRERVTTVQKGTGGNDDIFVTGIPVFEGSTLRMIISYSSWEVTGFEDLRERYDVLELQNKKLLREIDLLDNRNSGKKFIAKSARSIDARRLIGIFCDAGCPCFIHGPVGSGKSFLARNVYGRKGLIYTYDCYPLSADIIESELLSDKSMISSVSGIHAIIIKHIDRLSPTGQIKLLQKCDRTGIIPVGLSEYSCSELRAQNKLTDEFYGKFSPYQVKLYPVNERTEDLKCYIEHFLQLTNEKYSRGIELTPRALGCLMSYEWKENIDEIKRTLERIVLTAEKNVIDVFELPEEITGSRSAVFSQNATLKDMMDFYEGELIMQAYEKYHTTVAVAQKLGISQATAVRKIHKYKEK